MSKRAIAILIAGFFTMFTAYAIRYAYGMLLPEMLSDFQISKAQSGVIYSSYFITYTLASPFIGFFTDRYDTRKIISVFCLILGAGTLLMAFSSGVLSASLFFALAGLGTAACWIPVVVLIQRWVSDKRRGTAVTIADTGSAVGIAAWSALIPLIVAAFDWKAGWMVLGISGFIIAVLNYILLRDRPEMQARAKQDNNAVAERKKTAVPYKQILKDSKFWLIGISYLLVGFEVIIIFTFLPTYGIQSLKMTFAEAARLIMFISLAGVVGKLFLGPLSDKIGRIIVMITCCALMAIGGLGIVLLKNQSYLIWFVLIYGIGYGAVWSVYAACCVDLFPRDYAGVITGLWTFLMGVGSIAGPVISGWSIDISGSFTAAFVMASVAAVLGLLLLLPFKFGRYGK